MKYTNDRHANNLLKMLEMDNPCGYCPLGFDEIDGKLYEKCGLYENNLNSICKNFINININLYISGCPCRILDKKEAIKRTWIALEEGGYLD